MIKIFQINPNRDVNRVMFCRYDKFKKKDIQFDFSIYDEIWSGEEPDGCDDLEGIFEVFNLYHPQDFEGHSLSVSDIVQIVGSDEKSNGFYYCDSFGWEKLDENKINKY